MKNGERITLDLTIAEANAVRLCLNGELESDDGGHGDYMKALASVVEKLDEARG